MRAAFVAVAALVVACDHPTPFTVGEYTPGGPMSPPPAVRLTINPGADLGPTWLPSDTGILYVAERYDRRDHDRCFAFLKSTGGAIGRYVCRTTAPNDSLDAFEGPAVSPDARIAYVRASSALPFPPLSPDVQALVVAGLDDPNAVRVLHAIPYTAPSPSGRPHQGVSHIAWLSPTLLVYLGESVTYPRSCSSCVPDTVRTGIEIVTLDFGAPTPVLAIVPGTDSASSVAVGATGDTIYFTRNGDGRVYRRALSSGQTDTVYDFAATGIARDVTVAAGKLVAVVGGDVSYVVDSVLGASQTDRGGELRVVTLGTGVETAFGDSAARYRHPALSRDARRVAVEARTGASSDLWLLDVP